MIEYLSFSQWKARNLDILEPRKCVPCNGRGLIVENGSAYLCGNCDGTGQVQPDALSLYKAQIQKDRQGMNDWRRMVTE